MESNIDKPGDLPNYVLKTNEAVLYPVEVGGVQKFVNICVKVIIIVIIVGSLLFQVNLFSELSDMTKILLIGLFIRFVLFGTPKEYGPSPMELQFYNDYLVMYQPKRYYSKRVTRMEFSKMNYADIDKCVFKTKSQRVHLYGSGVSTWWNYRKDGTLPDKPTKVNEYTDGLLYFGTRMAIDIDFVKEIESHSPIKVIIEES